MTRRLLLALITLLLPTALLAHTAAGPHGGQSVDSGPYFLELVLEKGRIKVYVYDDATEKSVSMKSAKATATVLAGQKREVAQLTPDPAEENLLAGKLELEEQSGLRIVVQVQIPGQQSLVARFSI